MTRLHLVVVVVVVVFTSKTVRSLYAVPSVHASLTLDAVDKRGHRLTYPPRGHGDHVLKAHGVHHKPGFSKYTAPPEASVKNAI